MMTINKSSRWNRLRALAAVPVIALALLAFANPSNGTVVANEQGPAPSPQGTKVYETVEQMPEFPGGMEALINFLQENVKYPENAVKNNIEGRVFVQFIVDKTGQVCDAKVVRSVNEELDAEAIRVVNSMPNFIPGRQDGKAVSVFFTLPINFKLQSDEPKKE